MMNENIRVLHVVKELINRKTYRKHRSTCRWKYLSTRLLRIAPIHSRSHLKWERARERQSGREKDLIKNRMKPYATASMQDLCSINTWIDENVCNWLVLLWYLSINNIKRTPHTILAIIAALVACNTQYAKRKSLILIW